MYSKTVIVKDDCLLFVGEIWKLEHLGWISNTSRGFLVFQNIQVIYNMIKYFSDLISLLYSRVIPIIFKIVQLLMRTSYLLSNIFLH
ncbi:Uncharacterised protein [Niallia circulans]|nr:Uncharacterised protein [Niallia circulans]